MGCGEFHLIPSYYYHNNIPSNHWTDERNPTCLKGQSAGLLCEGYVGLPATIDRNVQRILQASSKQHQRRAQLAIGQQSVDDLAQCDGIIDNSELSEERWVDKEITEGREHMPERGEDVITGRVTLEAPNAVHSKVQTC